MVVFYVIEYVDSTHVTVRLHQDYHAVTKFDQPHIRTALAPLLPKVKKLLQDKPKSPQCLMQMASTLDAELKKQIFGVSVVTRWQAFAHIFRETFELYGNNLRLREDDDEDEADPDTPNLVKLTHFETCAMLRLTYALCYYSAQGTTIRDRHVVLFDTRNDKYTMRHLNVGMSRATNGRYIHIPNKEQEWKLMRASRVQ